MVVISGEENDGGNDRSSTITLDVTAVNDAPTIDPGQLFSLPATAANLDTVGIVDGGDVDTGDTLTWSITGGNPVGLFGMVGGTGELFVANNATLAPGQYVLTITVSDGTLTDVETVTVDVV